MNKEANWSDIVDRLRRECDSDYACDDEDDEWLWQDEDDNPTTTSAFSRRRCRT